MAVMTQLPPARSKTIVQLSQALEEQSVVSHLAGRLIQVTLALYLLPALLAVLVVGGTGSFVLTFSQLLTNPIKRSLD